MTVGQQDAPPAELLRLAELAECSGRLAEARDCFCRAVSEDDSPRARFEWAAFLARHGDYRGAAVEWTRLWESLSGTGHDPLVSTVCHNLACVARRQRDWLTAQRWQQRATAASARGTGEPVDASALVGAANDALAARRWKDAERFLRTALRVAERHDDTGAVADVLGTFGVLHQLRGRLSKAIPLHRDAFPLHRQVGDDGGAAGDCLNLASIAIARGRVRAALSAARVAVRFAARSGDRSLIDQADATVAALRGAIAKLSHPVQCN